MKLSVYREVALKELTELTPSDILFFEYEEEIKKIIVRTHSKEYYLTGSIIYWNDLMAINGFNFMIAGRDSIINIDQVRAVECGRNFAYFENTPTPDSKYCAFSKARFMYLVDKIGIPLSRVKFAEKRKELILI
ncbi:LytTR family transcriptional regulator DNA-binding domain-containing protein [Paenibacillus sp. FSL L8-0463]|uniref:LytTR family transcriptional regulator DNA-binding domain-containing protein n=1 Tax=Paenibacillus sp. FSL L8-0463 TaxID=2954687 RepID=UPI0031193EBC